MLPSNKSGVVFESAENEFKGIDNDAIRIEALRSLEAARRPPHSPQQGHDRGEVVCSYLETAPNNFINRGGAAGRGSREMQADAVSLESCARNQQGELQVRLAFSAA